MSEHEIMPALTPEEWRDALRDRAGMAAAMQRAWGDDTHRENDHALAALCLIYKPFGFTHDLVPWLREAALLIKDGPVGRPELRMIDACERAAALIAALLPPPEVSRETSPGAGGVAPGS